MQCFTELTPPTAVTHALCFPFVSPTSTNLVLAKTSLLQIFALKTLSTEVDTSVEERDDDTQLKDRRMLDSDGLERSFLATDVTLQRAQRAHNTKLVLVAEYALSGTITSLARVKILHSKTGAEALLVSSKDAKLSLVEWDPDVHGISTLSIHFYEREDLHGPPWTPDPAHCVSYLTADPSSRCAALKFGARNLAILPFHQPGDDLVMDDYDADLDGERPPSKAANGDTPHSNTPYASSFVLPLSTLDFSLVHAIHLSFLHEYREPTFGILSSPLATSCALLHDRRDLLSYTVFTLDLEQRASTTILSVTDLPYDLLRVVPLPTPVGGALLVGGNELIHVDQAGKTNGVAVNIFAKECSSFGMADQSDLNMRLEGSMIEQLGVENGEMLMVLRTGELAIVSFRLDGRSVSGLSVRRVSEEDGGLVVQAPPSCLASLGRGKIFVGSEDADSLVLGWSRKSKQSAKQKPQVGASDDMEEGERYFDDVDDYEDDLYSGGVTDGRKDSAALLSAISKTGDYAFRVHDSLVNIGPLKDVAFGHKAYDDDGADEKCKDVVGDIELVATSGTGRAGGIAVLSREIEPKVISRFDFPEATGIWAISVKRPVAKALTGKTKAELDRGYGIDEDFDRFVIVSRTSEKGEESAVYAPASTGFEELKDTEFDPSAGGTVDVGSTGDDLGLAQILPMMDESTETEPKAVSCSFADPYMLVIRDDASVMVLQSDQSGDLEELERGDALVGPRWLSGSLYRDRERFFQVPPTMKEGQQVLMFLLSDEGSLCIYALPDLNNPIFIGQTVSTLPTVIAPDYPVQRSSRRETLSEILVADLGTSVFKTPHLIFRAVNDEMIIYEPFYSSADPDESGRSTLRFLKISNPHLPSPPVSTQDEAAGVGQALRAVDDIGGYSVVFLPGAPASFLVKSATSIPRVLSVRGEAVKGMSGFHTAECDRGWVYVDVEGVVRVARFSPDVQYAELGWGMKRVALGEEVHALDYQEPMQSYVLGTSSPADFELPKDDELHREWAHQDTPFKPQVEQGAIKLLTPINWTIIDTYEIRPFETVLCVKTISMEISEHTRARKALIAVGTVLAPLPDQASKGCLYVFEIIPVVPVPGKPETDRRLKLVAKEEVKGAVTAVTEVGTQGFLLEAQGQKCMVRGLKEDGSLLPVAFMDVMCHVSALRCLPQTGMCLVGDAVKGLWLVGYTEEPYKMTLFGKSTTRLEVIAADFLPDGDALYVVVADGDCNLHVLQFDPEHPKSLSGTRLLHHSSFHAGSPPSTLTRIPSSLSPSAHQIMHTSPSGALSLLTPLNESTYRRLSALASTLSTTLDPACGLNARAYRAASSSAAAAAGMSGEGYAGRGIVDGNVLRRWNELGVGRKLEVAGRVGVDAEEIRADLGSVAIGAPGGLAFL
ncbi:MAG: mRNA cleavage and polyadenylation factor subunit [Thelocarpon impressellum]|nr:MAG: mRNA cleavage and polyadenylation factor subunit [Thelocarpon impressellum]